MGRFIASMSLVLLPSMACGSAVQQDTTLPQRSQYANPSSTARRQPASVATLFEDVAMRARGLSQTEYSPAETILPAALARLDYDQYRSIRFRPEVSLWRNESLFEVQLFHLGSVYREPVRIHLVDEKKIATLPFDRTLFRYDGRAAAVADTVVPELGYAGFRIHYPLNDSAIQDEVVVFLGASYFRLLGKGHVYGLSSRGLAVDVAQDSGEEFPAFREFWLVRPAPAATTATFFALLDSPSVTGAYRFDLEPGAPTTLDVEARLYARETVAKLGVAPLSSMFLYGQNRMPAFDDFRPQVHDSDGLLMHTSSDEWIWRPLGNGPRVHVTSLPDHMPRGFGLVQRDRNFDSYLDVEANYHRRPSEWVTVGDGNWGSGSVELLAFPTDSEFTDNIAVYWVPDQPFLAGDERRYHYRLTTFDGRLEDQTLAQVERTRIGWDALPGQRDPPPRSQRRFIVDFARGDVFVPESAPPVDAVLETSTGRVSDLVVHPLPGGGWRASFRLTPADNRPAEMRLYLELEGRRVSETWSYIWYPDHAQE